MLPDVIERVAAFVRAQAADADVVLVTGGLGGTPDDITREAIAAAFGVPQEEQPEVAERLRARFSGDPDYVTRWAQLPAGSRALENPLGGAPGFVIGNVYVLPGLPAEMEAMFETLVDELRAGAPIGAWRRTYRTTESRIVGVLEEMGERHPGVPVGSYPSFETAAARSRSWSSPPTPTRWRPAVAWIEPELDAPPGSRPERGGLVSCVTAACQSMAARHARARRYLIPVPIAVATVAGFVDGCAADRGRCGQRSDKP